MAHMKSMVFKALLVLLVALPQLSWAAAVEGAPAQLADGLYSEDLPPLVQDEGFDESDVNMAASNREDGAAPAKYWCVSCNKWVAVGPTGRVSDKSAVQVASNATSTRRGTKKTIPVDRDGSTATTR